MFLFLLFFVYHFVFSCIPAIFLLYPLLARLPSLSSINKPAVFLDTAFMDVFRAFDISGYNAHRYLVFIRFVYSRTLIFMYVHFTASFQEERKISLFDRFNSI